MRPSTFILAGGLASAASIQSAAQSATASSRPLAPSAIASAIDLVIDRSLSENRLVGLVVLVAQDGHVLYHRAAGFADREARRPMREDALFRLASLTKPAVSAATLALVDRGVLSLDDPVTRWLPDFRPRLADGSAPVITVRSLLTHTAGLTYRFFQNPVTGSYVRAGVSDGLDDSRISLDENMRRIASVPLGYSPETAWGYSVAHDVLGALISKAAATPLPDLVRSLVTEPLGLHDMAFTVRDTARLAAAYTDGSPIPIRMAEPQEFAYPGLGAVFQFSPSRALDPSAFPSGGAGMIGTASDYLALLEAIRTGGGPILTKASASAMAQNQIGALRALPGWGWGLAGAVLVDPAEAQTPQSVGTMFWGGVYGSSWFIDPQRRLTVVALTNTALEGMVGRFPTELRDAIYSALQK